jgi:hypothetical protein
VERADFVARAKAEAEDDIVIGTSMMSIKDPVSQIPGPDSLSALVYADQSPGTVDQVLAYTML